MTVSHTAASVTSIDWTVVAGAAATFVTTAFLTWQGIKKGRENVQAKAHIEAEDRQSLVMRGGVLMDNMTMKVLSEQLRISNESVEDHTRALDQSTAVQLKVWEQLVEVKMELRALIILLGHR